MFRASQSKMSRGRIICFLKRSVNAANGFYSKVLYKRVVLGSALNKKKTLERISQYKEDFLEDELIKLH